MRKLDSVAEILNTLSGGEVRCTSLDKLCAYEKTELLPETARDCNCQIIGGGATGTTRSTKDTADSR